MSTKKREKIKEDIDEIQESGDVSSEEAEKTKSYIDNLPNDKLDQVESIIIDMKKDNEE